MPRGSAFTRTRVSSVVTRGGGGTSEAWLHLCLGLGPLAGGELPPMPPSAEVLRGGGCIGLGAPWGGGWRWSGMTLVQPLQMWTLAQGGPPHPNHVKVAPPQCGLPHLYPPRPPRCSGWGVRLPPPPPRTHCIFITTSHSALGRGRPLRAHPGSASAPQIHVFCFANLLVNFG